MYKRKQLLIHTPANHERAIMVSVCSATSTVSLIRQKPETLLTETIASLLNDEHTLALLDLQSVVDSGMALPRLSAALLNPKARARVALLVRNASLFQNQRAWYQSLGFGVILSDLDTQNPEGEMQALVRWISARCEVPMPDIAKLRTYLKAVPDDLGRDSPRRRIRQLSGLNPEVCLQTLMAKVEIDDRRFHLQSYENCFVSRAACEVMSRLFRLSSNQAIELGRALQSCGLIYHVAQEQNFSNEEFFFRPNHWSRVENLSLESIVTKLHSAQGSLIKNRTWKLQEFESCLVGSEAIDWLVNQLSINRVEAQAVMERLYQAGLVTHVTDEHRFSDTKKFYRLRRLD